MNKKIRISFETFKLMPLDRQKNYFESLIKAHDDLQKTIFSLEHNTCSNCEHDFKNRKLCLAGVIRPCFETSTSEETNKLDSNCSYCCGIFWEKKHIKKTKQGIFLKAR